MPARLAPARPRPTTTVGESAVVRPVRDTVSASTLVQSDPERGGRRWGDREVKLTTSEAVLA